MSTNPKNVFEWSKAYFRNEDRSLHETRATMAALMTYADFDALTCFPSQKTLARITGTHVDTIRRHVAKNVKAGWLVKLEAGNVNGRSTKYLLTVPAPCTGAGTLPAEVQPASLHGCGDPPCMDAPLTIHRSTQGSIHGTTRGAVDDGDDPGVPSQDGTPGAMNHPIAETNHEPPRTDAGTPGGTATGRSLANDPSAPEGDGDLVAQFKRQMAQGHSWFDPDTPVILWQSGTPLPGHAEDPFGPVYLDDVTGERLN
jgi:hypothetical protein